MNFIERIQNKPQAAKIRIIWTVAIIVGVLLIVVWIISAHFNKKTAPDTTLFQTLGQGFKDVKNNYRK